MKPHSLHRGGRARALLGVAALALASAAPQADLIGLLPGFGKPPTPQYSGYLNASAAEPGTMLHYWYAQSSAPDWHRRPVVMWLNGGPGSSSILGMLQELGPLLMDRNGDLMTNDWGWTKVANLLVLESPAGVGYSYCADQFIGGVCSNTDESTAAAAHAALVDFFHVKFPELMRLPFFITGESYAGIYVPTLAKRILDGNVLGKSKINLHGLGVGDPCTDNDAQRESMDMLWYGHKYGFVPDEQYEMLWGQCGHRFPRAISAGRWIASSSGVRAASAASAAAARTAQEMPRRTEEMPRSEQQQEAGETVAARGAAAIASASKRAVAARALHTESAAAQKRKGGAYMSLLAADMDERDSRRCEVERRKFLLSTSNAFSQQWVHSFINDLTLFGPSDIVRSDIVGSLNYRMAQWMMREDVRKALHVEFAPVSEWPGPSAGWEYVSNYSACNDDAPPGAPSMVDFYRELAPRLPGRVLVYNGDTDPCVTYEGTRAAVLKVGFPEMPGGAYRPWFYNATATTALVLAQKDLLFGPDLSSVEEGPQLGGHVVDYMHGLSFATVHGSGHMVPQFRPRAALLMISQLLRNNTLSPLLPVDEQLAEMSDIGYELFMNNWTTRSQVPEAMTIM